jgi:hypothetical protein
MLMNIGIVEKDNECCRAPARATACTALLRHPPHAYVLSLRMHVTSLMFSPLVAMELASFQHTTWPAMSTLNLTFYVGSTQLRSVRECVRACVRACSPRRHPRQAFELPAQLEVCERHSVSVRTPMLPPPSRDRRCLPTMSDLHSWHCRCCLTHHVSPIQPTATTCTHLSASCRPCRPHATDRVRMTYCQVCN